MSLTSHPLEWAAHFLGDHYTTYQTYSPYARQAWSLLSTARSYAFLLVDQVTRKPDLATIALLLVVIFVSLKILDILWQTVMFWLRMVRRVVFWGGLVVLAAWMWTRGPEGVVEDVGYWVGVWKEEKEHWVERERVARLAGQRQAQAAMGAGRRGNGRWW